MLNLRDTTYVFYTQITVRKQYTKIENNGKPATVKRAGSAEKCLPVPGQRFPLPTMLRDEDRTTNPA